MKAILGAFLIFPMLSACNSAETSGGHGIDPGLSKIDDGLTGLSKVMGSALESDKELMSILTKNDTRFVLVLVDDQGMEKYLQSVGLTQAAFLSSPRVHEFLQSHILVSQTDKDGEYTSLSGFKWNIVTYGTKIPKIINNVAMSRFYSTISNYNTSADKYTSYIILTDAPLTDLKK
ncbi:hypothetical protein [Deinococcus sp.]|uniref:hypothetical protein n=1 Tax=Deinococcus sp. TaxID=47478 RepID=UPI003CC5E390